jgi:hypothetical protein
MIAGDAGVHPVEVDLSELVARRMPALLELRFEVQNALGHLVGVWSKAGLYPLNATACEEDKQAKGHEANDMAASEADQSKRCMRMERANKHWNRQARMPRRVTAINN